MTAPASAAGRWRPWLDRLAVGPVDVAVAIGAGLLQVGATAMAANHQHARPVWDAPALGLLVLGPLALAERRRYPVAVLAVTFWSTVGYALVGDGHGAPFLALIVAFVTAVAAGHRRAAIGAMVAGYVGFMWLGALSGGQRWPTAEAAVGLAAWLLVLLGVGEAIRVRRERAAEAAHVREEEARRKVSEERLRIARELHDILAHNISVINVQAATSLHRAERTEERAYAALATIKQVSQETLVELRSLLGTLRQGDEQAPRTPAPSLARLDDLVASAAATGVIAEVEVRGRDRPLPPGVDLAAYRIVQEALTNVARHAGTPRAEVRVEFGDEDLVVQVDDAGQARGPFAPGTGIVGMTERAAALGGRLVTGPRPGGGFRVRAWLPLRGRAVIRVVLADDQALVRAGFASLLGDEPDIEVVGEAADGAQAVALARSHRPDVVLMDIRMPGTDGLAATRAIAADDRLAAVRIVILTTFDLDEYLFDAIRAGASGFLVKDTEPAELLRAVRVVAAGDGLLSPGVTRQLIAHFAASSVPPPAAPLQSLTDREREVTALVAAGLSNDEIARRLYLSPATAKTHVNRAMTKLAARDRAQLVVFAYESGLVRPGWAG